MVSPNGASECSDLAADMPYDSLQATGGRPRGTPEAVTGVGRACPATATVALHRCGWDAIRHMNDGGITSPCFP